MLLQKGVDKNITEVIKNLYKKISDCEKPITRNLRFLKRKKM